MSETYIEYVVEWTDADDGTRNRDMPTRKRQHAELVAEYCCQGRSFRRDARVLQREVTVGDWTEVTPAEKAIAAGDPRLVVNFEGSRKSVKKAQKFIEDRNKRRST